MRHLCFFVVALLAVASVAGEENSSASLRQFNGCVGALGQPESLKFDGNRTFSSKDLTAALFSDLDVFLASRPSKLLQDYLSLLAQKLEKGYRQAGFPSVIVRARKDGEESICVKIDEGPRYLAGEVRVTNAKTISVPKLVERLTSKRRPKDAVSQTYVERNGKLESVWLDKDGKGLKLEDPIWCREKPASFLAEGEPESSLHEDVKDAFADLGYFFARFAVSVLPDVKTKKAVLTVNIFDEGPLCTLDNITVHGNKKNSRKEILKYLAIKPDTALNVEELARIRTSLWKSGRFIKSNLTPVPPTVFGGKGGLNIELIELAGAPPLSKPLSREEEVVLRFREWLTHQDRWNGDFYYYYVGKDGQHAAVASPKHGGMFECRWQETTTSRPRGFAVIASPEETGFYNTADGRKFVFPSVDKTIIVSLQLRLEDDANEKKIERHFISWGLGFGEKSKEDPPVVFAITMAPVFAIDLVHDCEQCAIHNGILTIVKPNYYTIRIDAASGELVEVVAALGDEAEGQKSTEKKTSQKALSPQATGRVTFVRDEFQRRATAVRFLAAKHRNYFVASRPVTAILKYVLDEDLIWNQPKLKQHKLKQSTCQTLERLLDHDICAPLDALVICLASDTENAFSIPIARRNDSTQMFLGIWAWRVMQKCLPPDSWPDTVCRAIILSMIGENNAAAEDWRQLLQSEQLGPIGSRAVALLMQTANPQFASSAHEQSQRSFTVKDVRKEFPVFLDRKYQVGKTFRRLLLAIRTLDDADVQALSELFPDDKTAEAFRHWANGWRKDKERSPDQAFEQLLDDLWNGGLRDYLAKLNDKESDAAKTNTGAKVGSTKAKSANYTKK